MRIVCVINCATSEERAIPSSSVIPVCDNTPTRYSPQPDDVFQNRQLNVQPTRKMAGWPTVLRWVFIPLQFLLKPDIAHNDIPNRVSTSRKILTGSANSWRSSRLYNIHFNYRYVYNLSGHVRFLDRSRLSPLNETEFLRDMIGRERVVERESHFRQRRYQTACLKMPIKLLSFTLYKVSRNCYRFFYNRKL